MHFVAQSLDAERKTLTLHISKGAPVTHCQMRAQDDHPCSEGPRPAEKDSLPLSRSDP